MKAVERRAAPWPAFLICALVGTAGCEAPEAAVVPAAVTIASASPGERLSPALFGTNLQWEHGGDGLLETSGSPPVFRTTAITAIRETGVTSIRFPGGSLSNTYEWRSSIGPQERRSAGVSFAGEKIASLFGTDELIALSAMLQVPPVLTVNSSESYQSAKEWVEYVNETPSERSSLAAQYWEIGNEVYSPNERGYATADEYARRTNEFAAAMKAADPGISIGAAVEVSFSQAAWMKDVYPHLLAWNESVIQTLSDDVDFLSLHFYAPFDKLLDGEALSKVVLAAPLAFRENVASIRDLLRKHGRGDMRLAITEYATFFGDERSLDERTAGPEGALFVALMLFEMAGQADIVLANHWSLANNDVFGMIVIDGEGEVSRRPAQHVFAALAAQQGNRVLDAAVVSPSYSVAALGNVPALPEVPYLDVLVTAEDDGDKTVNLVNRSTDTTLAVTLRETGTRLESAIVRQWHGTSTELWVSAHSQWALSSTDAGLPTILLPPFSFTTVQIDASVAE